MKLGLTGLLTAAALALAISSASAVVVTNVDDAPDAYTHIDLGDTLSLGGGNWVTANTPATQNNSVSGVARSPFDDSANGTPVGDPGPNELDGWQGTLEYFSVGPGSGTTEAILTFTEDKQSFSFLWGSVDTYNGLKFYLDGSAVAVAAITNTDIAPGAVIGTGASYVTVSDIVFDEVHFLSETNAFEFSSISTSPVPVPAALPLFGTGLAIMGFFGWRRRRQKAAAA